MDFDLRGLLRRVAEEVEAEIRQVEKELAEVERRARRVGAKRRVEELSAIRDILYEDKWYRIATAVYARLKRQLAEDGKAGELLEAARSRLFGLRLEVVEVPLLKIEAAVDREGKMAAVRCRAALDLGVEAVFEGTAPGYKLENVHVDKSAGTAVGAVRRGEEEEGKVERVLEEVRREFSGLPVYVDVEDGYVYVKRTAPMDRGQFRRYLETCKRLGFRFDRRGERWVKPLEERQPSPAV
jgi:vacuolar-type H+-ATPase subunit I/STV1